MDQKPAASINPLSKHFRQPAIYLKLPSQGSYWKPGALELPVNGEIPILPMTTKDEIVLRTPDALLNGAGVVAAVQSCCPSIKDAWETPSVDIDAVIIAIRIASYGNQMDFNSCCPHCNETSDYAINLGNVLSSIEVPDYSKKLEITDLKIKLKPQNYAAMNKASMISFEEQQLMRTLETLDEDNQEEVRKKFDNHLDRLIDLNIETLASCTDYIETEENVIVNNVEHIHDFYKNCDTKVIKAIQEQLSSLAESVKLKPVEVNCHSCEKPFDVNIEFDWANFFASGS